MASSLVGQLPQLCTDILVVAPSRNHQGWIQWPSRDRADGRNTRNLDCLKEKRVSYDEETIVLDVLFCDVVANSLSPTSSFVPSFGTTK
jgi:hypothetical protein